MASPPSPEGGAKFPNCSLTLAIAICELLCVLMVLSAGGAKGLSAISYMNQVASERLKMYTCVCVYGVYGV